MRSDTAGPRACRPGSQLLWVGCFLRVPWGRLGSTIIVSPWWPDCKHFKGIFTVLTYSIIRGQIGTRSTSGLPACHEFPRPASRCLRANGLLFQSVDVSDSAPYGAPGAFAHPFTLQAAMRRRWGRRGGSGDLLASPVFSAD